MGKSPTVGPPANNIEFSIDVELRNLSFKDYMKIKSVFEKEIIATEPQTLDFEKIVDILRLDKRKYYSRSIEYPQLDRNDEFEPKVTKIEISG
jgi:hypothetical protein